MRVSLLLPLILLTVSPPCRAGWGGPGATGVTGNPGLTNSATASIGYAGVRTNAAPAGIAPVSRGVTAAPTLGTSHPAPGLVNGVARSVPITANARPVGTVNAPRPLMNPGVGVPAARSPLPVVAASSSRLAAFAANADANRNRSPYPGPNLPRRPERPRPLPTYIFYPDNPYYGGRRPGRYAPGENYVQDTSLYPYASSPTYYLGGAFPYFYGGAIGTYGVATGVTSEATAAAPAPAGDAAPAEGAPPVAAENTREKPPRTPDLAGANSLVEAVQGELLRRGYLAGHPDGVFRADTGEALRRFQENHGLAGTGLVNEATLFALGLN